MYKIFLILICFSTAHAASTPDRTVNAKYIKNGAAILTVPTSTGVMITRTSTDTLTNKSIDATTNTISNIANTNVSTSAAISYSKLNLTGSIVNTDVSTGAAISYSKLNLSNSIVNTDVSTGAAIDRSKIASGTAYHVVVNDAYGNMVTGVAPGTSGNVLQSNGTSWVSAANSVTNPVTAVSGAQKLVSLWFAGNGSGSASCSSDPCTIVSQSGGVSSVNRSGAGVYTVNLTGTPFSEVPRCSGTGDPNYAGNVVVYNSTSSTSTTLYVQSLDASGVGADGAVHINCFGAP